MSTQAIYQESCTNTITRIEGGTVSLIHADPPWRYTGGSQTSKRGQAAAYYKGLPEKVIAEHVASTFELVRENGYLVVWCTFPKLLQWARQDAVLTTAGWQYVTGGAWGKLNGLGVGFHFRGDAELVLLYKKGSMLPNNKSTSNLWLDKRIGHSEKPQKVLRSLLGMSTNRGDTVLDLYAGASASMARACRALDRNYIGAEIDPARHKEALRRLALEEQSELFGSPVEAQYT